MDNKMNEKMDSEEFQKISQRIDELENSIKNTKDSELYNIFLAGKADELFKQARNKLLLWVSPVLVALLILGFNTYESFKKVTTYREEAQRELQNVRYFFQDENRIRTLKMLLANFYTVRNVRIPLGFVIVDQNKTDGFAESKIKKISASISKPSIEGEEKALYGEVEFSASNFPATISINNFIPSKSIHINELEKYTHLNVEVMIDVKDGFNYDQAEMVMPYTHTGYLSTSGVNGIPFFNEGNNIEEQFRSKRYPQSFEAEYDKDDSVIKCHISYDITAILSDSKHKYEKSHLLFQ